MVQECLICGSKTILKANSYSGYQAPTVFEIYNCCNCNSSFSIPRVDASIEYDAIYRLGRSVPEYNRYWVYMDNIKLCKAPLLYLATAEDTYWGVASALQEGDSKKETVKIIEIGSGLGYLTYALNAEGYNAIGLDVSTVAVNNARQKFGNYYVAGNLFEYAESHQSEYDIVILTEVIEHVENPRSFLAAIFKLLKLNGKIILTTPNKSFFPNDTVWASTPPPIHCYWLGEESITWLANSLEATVKFVDFSDFYNKPKRVIDVSSITNFATIGPILDEKGDLCLSNQRDPSKSNAIILMLKKVPYLKSLRDVLYMFVNRDKFRTCGSRGLVLCAVLEKKSGKF